MFEVFEETCGGKNSFKEQRRGQLSHIMYMSRALFFLNSDPICIMNNSLALLSYSLCFI